MLNFLRKWLGISESLDDPYGIFFHAKCDKCGTAVRVRIHKMYDLNREEGSVVWRKTIVDSRCFQPMPTTVWFDGAYQPIKITIEGGHYLSAEDYAELQTAVNEPLPADNEA
jgi:hypothetical protein